MKPKRATMVKYTKAKYAAFFDEMEKVGLSATTRFLQKNPHRALAAAKRFSSAGLKMNRGSAKIVSRERMFGDLQANTQARFRSGEVDKMKRRVMDAAYKSRFGVKRVSARPSDTRVRPREVAA